MNWVFWLVLIIILTIIEVITINLVTIWFVVSGIVALILSFWITNSVILSTVFVVFGIILLLTTKPILDKLLKHSSPTNLERIIGSTGIVTESIKKDTIGEVKTDGKRWSAIADEEILEGEKVKIKKIDGVKLIVKKESD